MIDYNLFSVSSSKCDASLYSHIMDYKLYPCYQRHDDLPLDHEPPSIQSTLTIYFQPDISASQMQTQRLTNGSTLVAQRLHLIDPRFPGAQIRSEGFNGCQNLHPPLIKHGNGKWTSIQRGFYIAMFDYRRVHRCPSNCFSPTPDNTMSCMRIPSC